MKRNPQKRHHPIRNLLLIVLAVLCIGFFRQKSNVKKPAAASAKPAQAETRRPEPVQQTAGTTEEKTQPEKETETSEIEVKEETPAEAGQAEPTVENAEAPVPETPEEPEPVIDQNTIRPEFKEAMDSYEDFYREYVDFMKEYMKNPTNFSLLSKYASFMTKLEDMDEKFDAWDSDDLTDAELKYYLEVQLRIEKLLLEIA